jgi:hypothetical protein
VLGMTWSFCRKDRAAELEKERGLLSSRDGRATLVPGRDSNSLVLTNMATAGNGIRDKRKYWGLINNSLCQLPLQGPYRREIPESCCDEVCCVSSIPKMFLQLQGASLNMVRPPAFGGGSAWSVQHR